MKKEKGLMPMVLSLGVATALFIHYMSHDNQVVQSADESMEYQQQTRFSVEKLPDKSNRKASGLEEDIPFIHGKIGKLEKLDHRNLNLMVRNQREALQIRVTPNTYIGNMTKTPKKTLEFLEVGMVGHIHYYSEGGIHTATTININH